MKRLGLTVALLAAAAAVFAAVASADYGPGAVYQVEISANANGPQGGGIWLWIELNANGTGDYRGSDCGHGEGAARDNGDVTWTSGGGMLTISGVTLTGLGGLPVTITVPSAYGHKSYTGDAFSSIFGLPFPGNAQVQIAP